MKSHVLHPVLICCSSTLGDTFPTDTASAPVVNGSSTVTVGGRCRAGFDRSRGIAIKATDHDQQGCRRWSATGRVNENYRSSIRAAPYFTVTACRGGRVRQVWW